MNSQEHARCLFLEMLAFWLGKVQVKDLVNQFGVTRQCASKTILNYRQRHPAALDYSQHLYSFGYGQWPQYYRPDLESIAQWLETGRFTAQPAEAQSAVYTLQPPLRQYRLQSVRTLIQAMLEGRRVEVDYVSVSHPDHDGRIISPHALVKANGQFYIRAYCEKRTEFRNFALSRFGDDCEKLGPSTHRQSMDANWNLEVEIRYQPDSRLSAEQREVVIRDYQMVNGELVVPCKAALVENMVREMGVPTRFLSNVPEGQQLVIVNRSDIEQWLYGE